MHAIIQELFYIYHSPNSCTQQFKPTLKKNFDFPPLCGISSNNELRNKLTANNDALTRKVNIRVTTLLPFCSV